MPPSSQQIAQAPQPERANTADLTLEETTRVMDVARTLRKERSIAERELGRAETIALLQVKLREAADVAGDPVTDAQINAAIKQYYENLHEFRPPEPGWETFWAHVYVRRQQIIGWTLALGGAAAAAWGLRMAGML